MSAFNTGGVRAAINCDSPKAVLLAVIIADGVTNRVVVIVRGSAIGGYEKSRSIIPVAVIVLHDGIGYAVIEVKTIAVVAYGFVVVTLIGDEVDARGVKRPDAHATVGGKANCYMQCNFARSHH